MKSAESLVGVHTHTDSLIEYKKIKNLYVYFCNTQKYA